MKIISSLLTNNPFYKAGRTISVEGFMLHSVGCPQPSAPVFVKNWDKESYTRACVHAFIDGNTGDVYQTLPWNYRGGHAGGSANNTHIGVEMCEPSCIKYTTGANFTCNDPEAAKAVVKRTYESAVELFALLCETYNRDPLAPGVIISHREGGAIGVASSHADPEHLWKGLGLGYTMSTFRKAVSNKMNESNVIYRVQVGAFSKEIYAESMLKKIENAGFDGFITTIGGTPIVEEKPTSGIGITLPVIKNGSKGETVKTVQRLLNALGHKGANGKTLTVDGSCGGNTVHAIKSFQKANGLSVDGACGSQTWRALLT